MKWYPAHNLIGVILESFITVDKNDIFTIELLKN